MPKQAAYVDEREPVESSLGGKDVNDIGMALTLTSHGLAKTKMVPEHALETVRLTEPTIAVVSIHDQSNGLLLRAETPLAVPYATLGPWLFSGISL